MFRRLKTKFILMQLGIVFSLISLFNAGLLFSVYREINNYSNDTLEKIYNLDLIRPLPSHDLPREGIPKFLPFIDIVTDNLGNIIEVRDSEKSLDYRFTGEKESRNKRETENLDKEEVLGREEYLKKNLYQRLTIPLDENFNEEEYKLLLNSLKNLREVKGNTGVVKLKEKYFKYRIEENRFILLDVTLGINIILKIILRFFKISIPLLLVIYGISYKFASIWIKPVEESFEKQKEFVGNASHELRTPLTAISANLDVLSHCVEKEDEKWISNIKIESSRMKKLIEELLYLTKLDFEKSRNSFQVLNLSKVLEKYLISKEAVFYEKNLEVEWNIAPNLEIYGDFVEVEKLLGILIDNGVKYSSKILKIDLEKIGDKAQFKIYNSGEGISKEEIERIWDRFYRGDKSRRYTGGFGLGLAIGKKITENHSGTLEVQSKVGEYTEFILKIPLN